MLIEIWQQICKNSEDYRSSTVLTALDYAKAFNRLSFQHCLEAFRRKGSSSPIIRIISSFLTNRTMSVRVGQTWSSPRSVSGGCPQGSILGILLFNMVTDDLEDNFLRSELRAIDEPGLELVEDDLPDELPGPAGATTAVSSPITTSPPPLTSELSPIGTGFYNHDGTSVSFIAGSRNVPVLGISQDSQIVVPPEENTGTQNFTEKKTLIVKYVDDSVSIEKLNFGTVPVTVEEEMPVKRRLAPRSQNAFRSITRNAIRKKMKVNEMKTKLLCIAENLNYTPKVFIEGNSGEKIECGESVRILGFDFSNKPTVHLHVNGILRRLRRRFWMLRHLKKFGMNEENLVKVYTSSVVPIADYCDYVYHSMLTDEQDELLENAQAGALRVIFGPGISARKMRARAGVKSLRERRIEHADRFANKAVASEKFKSWFPLRSGRSSARSGEKYEEKFARLDRLKNSPLFYMRRRLNGKVGKYYGERYRVYRET